MTRKPSRLLNKSETSTVKMAKGDRLTASFEFIGDNNGKTFKI